MDIKLYHKPTSLIQVCPECGKQLIEGEIIARVLYKYYGFPKYDYYHPDCVVQSVKRTIENQKKKFTNANVLKTTKLNNWTGGIKNELDKK
jgi:predicted RNA-binding Zn-ribbon protein involved in translation (DUF1610 family)